MGKEWIDDKVADGITSIYGQADAVCWMIIVDSYDSWLFVI